MTIYLPPQGLPHRQAGHHCSTHDRPSLDEQSPHRAQRLPPPTHPTRRRSHRHSKNNKDCSDAEAATNAVRRFLAGTRMPEDAAELQQLSPSSRLP